MTGFANADVQRVSQGGGSLQVTMPALGAVAIQATSTPTPCRECYIDVPSAGTNRDVHFAINTSVNVSLGAHIPSTSGDNKSRFSALRVPIDDLSKLWFWQTSFFLDNVVGVSYRT